MPKFQDTTPVPHSAGQMFDLVADVERYPEFLPMCEALRVKERRERDGMTMLIADMTVGYKMIRETFTSRVLLKPEQNIIDVSYLEGPFRYLNNRWTFRAAQRRRLRRGLFHRLRIQEPRARHGDGRHVRQGVPHVFQRVSKTGETYSLPEHTLDQCCRLPDWWEDVQAPHIQSLGDLLQVWQDKDLAKSVKAKALFAAMREFDGRDDEIVSQAINLYPYVDPGYDDLIELLEYGVGQYFDFDRSLESYSGKTGDTTAGLVLKLAKRYLSDGRPVDAALLLRDLVRDRGGEINDHQLELASIAMADALKSMGRNADAARVLSNAVTAYDGSWEKRITEERTELRERMGLPAYLWAISPVKYLLYGLLALLAVAVVVSRKRRPPSVRFGRSATP
jgi:ribosome-associated toxin RatA of RatAB toxin-antitoxin module